MTPADLEDNDSMLRITLAALIVTVVASGALAQGDEEILETLHESITALYLEQLPGELPESFNAGLAPEDRERIIKQLAEDCADCFVEAVVKYADRFDVPLSGFVADGVVSPRGGPAGEFEQLLYPCIFAARQAAGIVDQ